MVAKERISLAKSIRTLTKKPCLEKTWTRNPAQKRPILKVREVKWPGPKAEAWPEVKGRESDPAPRPKRSKRPRRPKRPDLK